MKLFGPKIKILIISEFLSFNGIFQYLDVEFKYIYS